MEKLRIGGIWVGVIELELENWTLSMLREEVAKRSNAPQGPNSINLISSGKVLKDGDDSENLTQLAATALSKRHVDGSLPIEDFNIELENQGGQKVQLGTETDQRAVMMGLMLHENAKNLIRKELYKNATHHGGVIGNVPILQIDMVWCYFLLRDISWLSVAGICLEKAREGLERCHEKDFSCVRLLQADCQPELALQVPDEALCHVMSMGFKERDAMRALRLNNQDIRTAVDFLFEEKAKRAQKREDDILHRMEIMEQKQYGVTPLKKAVNLEKLKELVAIGLAAFCMKLPKFSLLLAVAIIDYVCLQLDIESRKRKRKQQIADARIEELVSMGFDRSRVVAAVQAGETMEQTMSQLLSDSEPVPTIVANSNGNPASEPNNVNPDSLNNNNTVEGPSTAAKEERDAEMEDELARDIESADALSDYDIEVTKEGEAINEYLTLLASTDS
ncbi:hypothetical protein REPUB_Repub03eG0106400 [Reevesia pubescens]